MKLLFLIIFMVGCSEEPCTDYLSPAEGNRMREEIKTLEKKIKAYRRSMPINVYMELEARAVE